MSVLEPFPVRLLRRERQKRNLSVEQVAVAVGVSSRTIARWESGESHPRLRDLFTLSKMFGPVETKRRTA